MAKLSEERLLADYLRPLCDKKVAHDLKDDSAALPRRDYIISTDNLVEGVHFLPDFSPAQIASRLLARNLSDMAGSAARPCYYLLNWLVTEAQDEAWVAEFCDTLAEWQEQYGMRLIGGDGSQGQSLSLSMTILGEPLRLPPPVRADAEIGDVVCVSGAIGSAYLGLLSLRGESVNLPEATLQTCRERFLSPAIPCQAIEKIIGLLGEDLHALTDISDGLFADAERIAQASDATIDITADDIPLLPEVQKLQIKDSALLERLVAGGDDYELLFSLAEHRADELLNFCRSENIAITAIGKVLKKQKESVRFTRDGHILPFHHKGWEIDYAR